MVLEWFWLVLGGSGVVLVGSGMVLGGSGMVVGCRGWFWCGSGMVLVDAGWFFFIDFTIGTGELGGAESSIFVDFQ